SLEKPTASGFTLGSASTVDAALTSAASVKAQAITDSKNEVAGFIVLTTHAGTGCAASLWDERIATGLRWLSARDDRISGVPSCPSRPAIEGWRPRHGGD